MKLIKIWKHALPHSDVPARTLFLLQNLNPPPQFPIPLIPYQIPVPGHAEGIFRRALGVALPVAPVRPLFPDSRGTGANGFFHALPDVVVGAQSQGDHRVHAGVILNGQMRADTLKMGKEAAARLSSRTSGHFTGEIQGQAGRP